MCGLLSNKNIRIQTPQQNWGPSLPLHYDTFGQTGGYYQKLSYDSETLDTTSEGLGEMFEGNSADTCAGKIPLVPRGAELIMMLQAYTKLKNQF